MSEKFNPLAGSNTFAEWFFIEAASQLNQKDFSELITKSENGLYEVELKINGKDVSFSKAMSLIDSQLAKLVKEKATDLLSEKISDICNSLEELRKIAETKLLSMQD
jgi:hypothetical protein